MPRTTDNAAQPVEVDAESATSSDEHVQAAGGVVVRQGNRRLAAQTIGLDRTTSLARADGGVRFSEPGVHVSGTTAGVDLSDGHVRIADAEFVLTDIEVRGYAQHMDRREDVVDLEGAMLTRCPPDSRAWRVRARSIHVDRDFATARGARLVVGGVPCTLRALPASAGNGQAHQRLSVPRYRLRRRGRHRPFAALLLQPGTELRRDPLAPIDRQARRRHRRRVQASERSVRNHPRRRIPVRGSTLRWTQGASRCGSGGPFLSCRPVVRSGRLPGARRPAADAGRLRGGQRQRLPRGSRRRVRVAASGVAGTTCRDSATPGAT